MRRLPAMAVGLVFLASISAPSIDAASPTLASSPTTAAVQKFVDSLLKIAEVQQAFQNGDTVEVQSGSGSWHGTVSGGKLALQAGDISATHTLIVDANAMMSIINAYNMPNTAKLAVKASYMVARSERQAVMTAIGAVARTPLDDRLPTTTPKIGDSITFQGCTGTLAAHDEGRFVVTLCDDRFTVNTIGGLTSKLPAEHLATNVDGAGDGPDQGDGESYGGDEDLYESCKDKVGRHPKKSNFYDIDDFDLDTDEGYDAYTEARQRYRAAHRLWHEALGACLEGSA